MTNSLRSSSHEINLNRKICLKDEARARKREEVKEKKNQQHKFTQDSNMCYQFQRRHLFKQKKNVQQRVLHTNIQPMMEKQIKLIMQRNAKHASRHSAQNSIFNK